MPFTSPYAPIRVPSCNLLSYIFADGRSEDTEPVWIDAVDPSRSLSLSQTHTLIKRFVVGLDNLGIPIGARILLFTPNHIYVPAVFLGTAGSKRVISGANPTYTASELGHQIQVLDASVLLIHPTVLEIGLAAAKENGIPNSRIFTFSDRPCEEVDGIKDWHSMLAPENEAAKWTWDPLGPAAATTIAYINLSSGTTGLPKGVCVSHSNLTANITQMIVNSFLGTNRSESNPGSEVWLGWLPLYHVLGQAFTIGVAARLRYKVYVMGKFTFVDFLKYIEKYKVTEIHAVPPVLVALQKMPLVKNYDLSSVRHVFVSAAPTGRDTLTAVEKLLGVKVHQGYGMTELTTGAIGTPYGEEHDPASPIGLLCASTEAKLVNDAGEEVVEEGQPGELLIRGPQVMMGYWRNDAANEECMEPDGFFHTGDVALWKKDKLGRQRWSLVDRKKELIKVRGLQVAPAELEAVLIGSPHVADAAVVGIRFEEDGEEWPRGYVVLQDSAKKAGIREKDVEQWVAGRVARYKWLRGGVKLMDEIPRLPSGKIVRRAMKELAKKDAQELRGRKVPSKL